MRGCVICGDPIIFRANMCQDCWAHESDNLFNDNDEEEQYDD